VFTELNPRSDPVAGALEVPETVRQASLPVDDAPAFVTRAPAVQGNAGPLLTTNVLSH
jgi:hypothetical protein